MTKLNRPIYSRYRRLLTNMGVLYQNYGESQRKFSKKRRKKINHELARIVTNYFVTDLFLIFKRKGTPHQDNGYPSVALRTSLVQGKVFRGKFIVIAGLLRVYIIVKQAEIA